MARLRVLNEGAVKDYEGFVRYAKRARQFVEANEPDTLTWECYADEGSGRGLLEESFADEDALLLHVQNSIDQGFVDEIIAVFELESIRVLGHVEDEKTRTIIDQFDAIQLQPLQQYMR